MDNDISHKIFKKLEECSQAAEQLSNSIIKFDSSGQKLNESIRKLTLLDKKLKTDNSFDVCLKAVEDINKIMSYFNEELPEFKGTISDSKEKLEEYKTEVSQSVEEIKQIYSEFGGLSSTFSSVSEIHEVIRGLNLNEIKIQVDSFKDELSNFSILYQNANTDLSNMVIEINNAELKFVSNIEELKNSMDKFQEIKLTTSQNCNIAINTAQDVIDITVENMLKSQKSFEKNIDKKIKQIKEELHIEEIDNKIQLLQELENRSLNQYESMFNDMQNSLLKEMINYFDQKINPEKNSSIFISKEAWKYRPKTDNERLSIAELFEKNSGKLPLVVMRYNWTDEYYYVIDEYKENTIHRGYYIKKGQRYGDGIPPNVNIREFFLVEYSV